MGLALFTVFFMVMLTTCTNSLVDNILSDVLITVPTVTGVERTNDTTPTWDWYGVADAVRYRYGFAE